MSYKPLEIEIIELGGIIPSMRAMKLPKHAVSDTERGPNGMVYLGPNDTKLAGRLIRAGNDHAKAMRGIIVWVEIKLQVGFMIEFETYRIGAECLSTSSAMHGELKKLEGSELAKQKQSDLAEKIYTRGMHLSYQVLRSMYRARKSHRHPDWRIWCKWIESLPYFQELIYPEFDVEKAVRLFR